MPIGLVTNCWQIQLASGESVEELVEQASRRGYRAIELRHGALGEFESGESRFPNASMLSRLPVRFPEVRFNVAIPFPFLAEAAKPTDPLFQAGLWAADAVKGCFPPHLRLVDLTTDLFEANPSVAAPPETLVSLTEALESIDGLLSIENARQPWRSFSAAFFEARRRLGRDRSRLKLCYDPVNLLLPGEEIDTLSATASLSGDEISMVHFKQRVDGRIATAVCDGDVDWESQVGILCRIGYRGPYLFEVASHKKLWEYLAGSREYLRRRGFHETDE